MKRIGLLAALVAVLAVPSLFAQDELNHVELGAFAELFRLSPVTPEINFVGLGGRLSVNVHHNVQLEGEMGYDFKRNFTSTFSNGVTTSTVTSRLRTLHGLFGPKIQTGGGAVRAFVTVKGGFLNFGVSNQSAPSGFTTQVGNVLGGDTNGVVYPGGGVEAYIGPVGLRLDVGDEIYFDNGANHNLKVTFGPSIRF
jgi:hypothetical protein